MGGNLSGTTLKDGISALRDVMRPSEVMRLIERTALWVDPETFRLLPLWYPEHARRSYFYKRNWSEPQMNKSRQTGHTEHKREGNIHANKALTYALGLRSDDRQNWSCCHIWGVDDALYQEANAVVQDHRYFSCVANMVLLPTPLKAFTDTMFEVKAMLRICARHLYGWHCDHKSLAAAIATVETWGDWDAYPKSWPRTHDAPLPPGVVKLDAGIRQSASRRLERIRHDLENAGEHYPRDRVREALAYWKIKL
jgi:hypothetical protein